jgi:hypothetical protein
MFANLVEEAGKMGRLHPRMFRSPSNTLLHCLGLRCFREAFRLGLIVRIAAVAHGANEALRGEQLPVIGRRLGSPA